MGEVLPAFTNRWDSNYDMCAYGVRRFRKEPDLVLHFDVFNSAEVDEVDRIMGWFPGVPYFVTWMAASPGWHRAGCDRLPAARTGGERG